MIKIKQILCQILTLFLPKIAVNSVRFIVKKFEIILFLNNNTHILKNIVLKEKGKNKRCFIIGNGQSLNKQDISLLKDECIFVMNDFWQHPVISNDWQPTYYCLAEPLYFNDKSGDFNLIKKFYKHINQKVKRCIFFVPYHAQSVIEKYKLLPIDKIYYLLFNDYLYERKENGIDLCKILPSAQSVAQMALQTAIYMAYSPIYLLGFDHDWLVYGEVQKHFHKNKSITIDPIRQNTKNNYVYRYKDEMIACLKLWQKYEELSDITDEKGIKIFNATDGGYLDVFPRVKYESLFNK